MATLLSIPKEVLLCDIFSRINYIPPRWVKNQGLALKNLFKAFVCDILDEHNLKKVCRKGDFYSVFYSDRHLSWSMGFKDACYSGNEDLVNLLLSKGGAPTHQGFMGACEGGHLGLVRRFRPSLEDTHLHRDGLSAAAKAGHEEVVEYLIKDTTLSTAHTHRQVLSTHALASACRGGQRRLVESLLNIGIAPDGSAATGACMSGDYHLVSAMFHRLSKRPAVRQNNLVFWMNAFKFACMSGSLEMVEFIHGKMEESSPKDYMLSYSHRLLRGKSSLYWGAVSGGNVKVVEFLISAKYRLTENAMSRACELGNLDIARFLTLSHGEILRSWRIFFGAACESGNVELVEFVRNYVISLDLLNEMKEIDRYGLEAACRAGRRNIIDFLLNNNTYLRIDVSMVQISSASGYLSTVEYIIGLLLPTGSPNKIRRDVLELCLSIACQKDRWEVIDWLLKRGVGVCSFCEQTPDQHLKCIDVVC